MKIECRVMKSIWGAVYRCQDEALEVTLSSSSGRRLVLFVVPYCCDIPEIKYMSGVLYRSMIDPPCIQRLVSRETFCTVNSAVNWNIAGTLSEYVSIKDMANESGNFWGGQEV